MENLIEAIHTALRDDAEPISRRAGLVACRKVLAMLETATAEEQLTTPPGEATAPSSAPTAPPMAEPAAAPSSTPTATHVAPTVQAPSIDPAAVATLVASLGKLPPEQLLDLAIARLRAALPPGVSAPPPATPLRFQIVPLHHLERSK